jgi:pectate lyase
MRSHLTVAAAAISAAVMVAASAVAAHAQEVEAGSGAGIAQPPSGPADGFASMNALDQDGTTGGAGGPSVTVGTATEFLDAIAQPGPLVVQVDGTIDLPGPMHDVSSDKTIIGLGSGAGITGGGLNIGLPIDDDITSPPADAVHNVIVQNLTFDDWADDAINVQMFSHHVWVDHNTFVEGSDGGVDVKRGSSFVTVSWNHILHDKNMLLGHDDDNGAQDVGRLNVTYHHNWFDSNNSRNPRVRFGDPVHVYNNYYLNNGDYGVASTQDAGVLVEGNFFEGVDDPFHLGEGDSGPGSIVDRDNCFVDSGDGEAGGSVADIPYEYELQPCEAVPGAVSAGAGAGNTAEPAQDELVGWATMEGGTTGGTGGDTVTVTDGDTLAELLEEDTPLVIQVQGMLSMPDGMNDVHSDKTIIGLGTSSGLDGAGLNITDGNGNIIIRNLNFEDWPDDAINVQDSAHHIWVDHNRFTTGGDGSVDVKRGSDFVTVSWNHTSHDKNMLLGHDDDNGGQDAGHLRVTYHHNWFDGSAERNPRVRFGNPVHVFNNYMDNNEVYGVASTVDAGVLVEGNYFENVPQPTAVGYAESPPGNLVDSGNVYVGSGEPESTGTGVDPIPYGYQLDDPNDVPALVMAGAGPQDSL